MLPWPHLRNSHGLHKRTKERKKIVWSALHRYKHHRYTRGGGGGGAAPLTPHLLSKFCSAGGEEKPQPPLPPPPPPEKLFLYAYFRHFLKYIIISLITLLMLGSRIFCFLCQILLSSAFYACIFLHKCRRKQNLTFRKQKILDPTLCLLIMHIDFRFLVQDLNETGYDTTYEAIEVGQTGFIEERKQNTNKTNPCIKKCGCNKRPKELISDLSRAALLASFIIFYSRYGHRHGLMHHTCQSNILGLILSKPSIYPIPT